MRKLASKILAVAILAALGSVFFSGQAVAANMLANPGFENVLNGWTIGGTGWQAQGTYVHSGTSAAKNTIPASVATTTHSAQLSQTFAATPGTTFYATAYAKSIISPLSTAKVALQVCFLNASSQVISYYEDVIGGTTDWRQLYVAKTAPAGTVQVKFQTYVFAVAGDTAAIGGAGYFDDTVLDTNYIAPPVPPFGLLNPNFENGLNDWWQNGPNWTLETAQPYSGVYSAKNTIGTIPGYDYFVDLAQDEPIAAGQTVYATLRVKTNINPASSAQAGVIVDFLNASHVPIAGTEVQNTVGGITPWTQVYVSTTAPSGAAYVRFRCLTFASQNDPLAIGGITYFDEAVLSTTYIAPPNNSQLVNPGFENGLNGWTILEPEVVNGTPATWALEQTTPFAGTKSAKNTINITNLKPTATSYFAAVGQTLTATPGTTYYATLYAKTAINPLSQAQAGLLVEFLNSSGVVIGTSQDTIGGNTNWEQLYVAATAPTLTTQVRYRCMVFAAKTDTVAHGGVASFDEAILSTVYIPPPGGSQLANPGFENGLNGWTILEPYLTSGTPATWGLETTAPFAGNYSAKNTININNLTSGQNYYAKASQTFVATAGTTYYSTLQAKTVINPSSQAQAGLLVEFLDASGNVIPGSSGQNTIGGTTAWQQMYVAVTAPAGTAQIRYNCMISAQNGDTAAHNGKAYFDEAVLSTTYIQPPNNSQLANPGFENGLNGWTVLEPFLANNTPATWGLETTAPFAGIYSAKNVINMNDLAPYPNPLYPTWDGNYYATLSQTFAATPNTTYYATAHAKTAINPASLAQAGILVEFLNSSNVVLASAKDTIGGTTSWEQLYVAALAPAGTAQVRYSTMVSVQRSDTAAHNGIVYFDENILSTTYIAPPGGSQLVNPGFENGLNGWDIKEPFLANNTPATWGLESAAPFAGVFSAKNTINITNLAPYPDPLHPDWDGNYYATVSQEFYITPGTTYYATLQTKTDISPTSSAQAGLLVEFLNSAGVVLESDQDVVGGNTNWQQMYVAHLAPAGTAKVRYSCMVFASRNDTAAHNGKVYFDEAVLTTTYIAPPGGSQLVNPGFENGLNGWTTVEPFLVSNTPATWGLEQAAPFAGVFSAKNTINITDLDPTIIPPNTQPENYYAAVKQEFDTVPNTVYYATLQAKTAINPLSPAKAGLVIEFLDSNGLVIKDTNGNPIGDKDVIGGNTPWRYLYATATAPAGSTKVRYSCIVSALRTDTDAHGGKAYFDEAVLSTSYIAPPSPPLVLLNPDFENGIHDWNVTEPALAGTSPIATWKAQTAQVYEGTIAMKNLINMNLKQGYDYYAALIQEMPAVPGAPVHATVQAATNFNQNSGAKAGLRVEFWDNSSPPQLLSFVKQELVGSNSWTELSVAQSAAPTGTAKIKYLLYVFASKTDTLANGGIAYFDIAQSDFIYINHLGYYQGQDTFPQETANPNYYTGPASVRMSLRYLLGTSPSQTSIYNTYHWTGPGNDMDFLEIVTAMNAETPAPYNYGDWHEASQLDAIKRFVYWIDYLPVGGTYCPAFVPMNGFLKWRLVRGIATNTDPNIPGQPMPNFNVEGLWINDPAVSGLGYNTYQTTTAFQTEFLPINGQYGSVYEPPLNLNQAAFQQEFERASVSLVPAIPSADLLREIQRMRATFSTSGAETSAGALSSTGSGNGDNIPIVPNQQVNTFVFNKEYIKQALPRALKHDASFMSLFYKASIIREFDVYSKDNNTHYKILALDAPASSSNPPLPGGGAQTDNLIVSEETISNPLDSMRVLAKSALSSGSGSTQIYKANTQQTVMMKTKILIEVNPLNGAILQATWNKNGETYLKVNQSQAVQIAQTYLANMQMKSTGSTGGYVRNMATQTSGTSQLVWSRNYKTSRFQPSWEVIFPNQQTVVVNQDGVCTIVPNGGGGTTTANSNVYLDQ